MEKDTVFLSLEKYEALKTSERELELIKESSIVVTDNHWQKCTVITNDEASIKLANDFKIKSNQLDTYEADYSKLKRDLKQMNIFQLIKWLRKTK